MKSKNGQGAPNEHVAEGRRVLPQHSGGNALAREFLLLFYAVLCYI